MTWTEECKSTVIISKSIRWIDCIHLPLSIGVDSSLWTTVENVWGANVTTRLVIVFHVGVPAERNKNRMEEPGFEPGTFRMRSGHSTTELHPHRIRPSAIWAYLKMSYVFRARIVTIYSIYIIFSYTSFVSMGPPRFVLTSNNSQISSKFTEDLFSVSYKQ